MSEHPIDVLRGIVLDCQDVLSSPEVHRGERALRAVEQLEGHIRDIRALAGGDSRGVGSLVPISGQEAREIRRAADAALALFDRKEQT